MEFGNWDLRFGKLPALEESLRFKNLEFRFGLKIYDLGFWIWNYDLGSYLRLEKI